MRRIKDRKVNQIDSMTGIANYNGQRTEERSYQPDSPRKKIYHKPDWVDMRDIRNRNEKGTFCLQEKMGFILLEVLVSVIILTIGLVAVLSAFSSSSKIITTSEKYQIALQLAEQKLYEITSTPEEDIRDYGHGEFGDKYPEYSWEYNIDEKDSEFYTDEAGFVLEPETYREITLTVSYVERGKTITPVTLVTYDTSKLRFVL